jgi:hypothetical protein
MEPPIIIKKKSAFFQKRPYTSGGSPLLLPFRSFAKEDVLAGVLKYSTSSNEISCPACRFSSPRIPDIMTGSVRTESAKYPQ